MSKEFIIIIIIIIIINCYRSCDQYCDVCACGIIAQNSVANDDRWFTGS